MKNEFNETLHNLEELESDLVWKRERKENLKNRLMNEIDLLDIEPTKEIKPRRTIRKTLTYISTAAVFSGVLLVGSAFVSPAMAQVISKIPVLNLLINQKDPIGIVVENLNKKGYEFNAVGISGRDLEINLIGTEEDVQKVSDEVKQLAETALAANGIDAYEVKITRFNVEDSKTVEDSHQFDPLLTRALEKENFDIYSLVSTIEEKLVFVELSHKETRTELLEEIVKNVMKENGIEIERVEVSKINIEKREQEDRWSIYIVSPIHDQLTARKELHVKGVSYTVHPIPHIMVNTTLDSSEKNAKEYAQKIEAEIKAYIETGEYAEHVKNEEYKISVFDINEEKLN